MASPGEKTFRVIVVAGLNLVACGGRVDAPTIDAAREATADAEDELTLDIPVPDAREVDPPDAAEEFGFPTEAPN